MTLYVREGSEFRPASADDILHRAQGVLAQRFRKGAPVLSAPSQAQEFLKVRLAALDHEVFGLLHLDSRYRLIAVEDLFRGTIDGASVYVREVVKSALAHGSAAVLLFHNHPSGVATPSPADELITQRVRDALALVDVRVVDHLVVAEDVYSFAQHGLL